MPPSEGPGRTRATACIVSVAFFASRRRKSERIAGFELAPGEKEDLIAFLKSLTDREFIDDPRFTSPF